MNDNIDNPPERLFVFFNHVDDKGNTLYTGGDIKMKGDIEYIRADVAKEREEAAFQRCLLSFPATEWP